MNGSSRALLNSWLAEYSREEPVYRFDNSLLDKRARAGSARPLSRAARVVVHWTNDMSHVRYVTAAGLASSPVGLQR